MIGRLLSRGVARALITLVQGYRLFFKAWVGNACRFTPSCSQYALDALERHGALGGAALGGWRLLRCHPWCAGGHDPVPDRLSDRLSDRLPACLPAVGGLFSRLIDRRPCDAVAPKKLP